MNICVFASGSGTNFSSILEHIKKGELHSDIKLLITNNSDCGAAVTARENNIEAVHISRKVYPDLSTGEYSNLFLKELEKHNTGLIVLAGYMKMLPAEVVRRYRGRIINIHPALLPKHGGKGMYGLNVHRAVLDAGEKETGVTVHFVDEEYDEGEIIFQQSIAVEDGDTPESLMARVKELEHRVYPMVIGEVARDLEKGLSF